MHSSPRFTRYLMRELAAPTFLGLFLWMFVLLMNHFFLVAEKALAKNLGAELTLRLFMVGIPKLLVMSIPMAVLLGTLIGLGRISADREWVALQAAGQGPGVVLRPVLFHGLLGALATFLIYAVVVPQTHYAVRSLRGEVIFSSNLAADLRPRVFYELQDNAVIHVEDIRAGGQRRLENVLLIRPDPERDGATRLFLSRFGDLYPAPDGSGAVLVDLFDGEVHYYRSDDPEAYQVATFRSIEGERFPPPRFLKTLMTPPSKVAQDLSIPELLAKIREAQAQRAELLERVEEPTPGHLRVSDRNIASAKIELHRRLALPLACLFFALLALPLGMSTARSGKGAGFAVSVVVIVVYRLVFVAATNQATLGRIPAELGPWVANAVILLWALVALRRMRRRPVRDERAAWRLPRVLWRRTGGRLRAAAPADSAVGDDASSAEVSTLAGLSGTTRRFIGRLDRYVALAFLRMFAFALVATYLIYAVVEGQELVDQTLRSNQSLALVADYLLYFPPGVLHVVMPIACLIGAVVSITLLARNSELVAVKAAGVSMVRVTVPVVVLSLLLGALLFYVQDRIAPAANRKAQESKDRIHRRAPRTHGLPATGSWRFGSDGSSLYHFRLHDTSKDEYQGLSVFNIDRTGPRIVDHRFSERARFDGATWWLDRGWHRSFSRLNGDPERATAAETESTLTRHDEPYSMALAIPPNLVDERRWLGHRSDDLPDQMSLAELSQQITTLRNSGYDITKLHVAYHRKFAQALSPLVMVLLGLPFAFSIGRRGSLYGIGVALLLVLVYWATFAVFNALGLETLLPPPVAAWAPNALYALLGTYLLLYVRT
jgi:LPS export ABC transporter permease LptG/LPS export ABC transporter permease LptF